MQIYCWPIDKVALTVDEQNALTIERERALINAQAAGIHI